MLNPFEARGRRRINKKVGDRRSMVEHWFVRTKCCGFGSRRSPKMKGEKTMKPDNKVIPFSEIQAGYESELRRKYSSIYFERFTLVDTNKSPLIIDDVSYRISQTAGAEVEMGFELMRMAILSGGDIERYDATSLTQVLAQQTQRFLDGMDPKKTVVIFPGSGAKTVKDIFSSESMDRLQTVTVNAKRKIDPRTNAVTGVEIGNKSQAKEAIADIRPSSIVVVDDTIATGATLRAVQDAFPSRNAQWYALSLMTLSPTQNRSNGKCDSGVEGYTSVVSPIVYQGTTGKPSLTSLSSIIGTTEKSQLVRQRFCERFIEEKDAFTEAIKALQQAVGYNT